MERTAQGPRLEALRRLLADSQPGGQAKVDALLALIQRRVCVPLIGRESGVFQTLLNRDGVEALPIFTDIDCLEQAAHLFGWNSVADGVPHQEISAREALRVAERFGYPMIVIDVGSLHALEVEHNEFTPLLGENSAEFAAGPYAGTGRLSSNLMKTVRPSMTTIRSEPPSRGYTTPAEPMLRAEPLLRAERKQTPMMQEAPQAKDGRYSLHFREDTADSTQDARREPALSLPPPSAALSQLTKQVAKRREDDTLKITYQGTPSGTWSSNEQQPAPTVLVPEKDWEFIAFTELPDQELTDRLSQILRIYPEIEWACIANYLSSQESEPRPLIGLRVDSRLRTRLDEIALHLITCAKGTLPRIQVGLLDEASVVREVRGTALMFYPWRAS